MSRLILADGRLKPQLFRWNGPVDPQQLRQWVSRHGWNVPHDLMEFWAITGGGEIFESETFLKPLVPPDHEDSVEHATDWFLRRGMPAGSLVFHEGLEITVVRCADGAYMTLDQSAQMINRYVSLDEWYVQFLREEYAPRYGLPPL